ncbi:hypothetical protein [Halosimplex halobium]|uniref:hypothetical protein n=1 Tax=Halosimplex halobium TaxID=3396618 RepID=UPI003F551BA8
MGEIGGDWTRRHARLTGEGQRDGTPPEANGGSGGRVVRADPPADDWTARHAWCRRA